MPTGPSDGDLLEENAAAAESRLKSREHLGIPAYWESHGTWTRRPLLIERAAVYAAGGSQVIEGQTRVGVLRGLLQRGQSVAPQARCLGDANSVIGSLRRSASQRRRARRDWPVEVAPDSSASPCALHGLLHSGRKDEPPAHQSRGHGRRAGRVRTGRRMATGRRRLDDAIEGVDAGARRCCSGWTRRRCRPGPTTSPPTSSATRSTVPATWCRSCRSAWLVSSSGWPSRGVVPALDRSCSCRACRLDHEETL